MAPFIRRVKTASGGSAVQIMEKQGCKNVLVRHVGSARSEAELAVLVQAAQDLFQPGQLSGGGSGRQNRFSA